MQSKEQLSAEICELLLNASGVPKVILTDWLNTAAGWNFFNSAEGRDFFNSAEGMDFFNPEKSISEMPISVLELIKKSLESST